MLHSHSQEVLPGNTQEIYKFYAAGFTVKLPLF